VYILFIVIHIEKVVHPAGELMLLRFEHKTKSQTEYTDN